jgi:hypothetical protein
MTKPWPGSAFFAAMNLSFGLSHCERDAPARSRRSFTSAAAHVDPFVERAGEVQHFAGKSDLNDREEV